MAQGIVVISRMFSGLGPFVGVAGVLVVMGVLATLLELQSPSLVLWTGIKVQGSTYDGLAHYSYGGESFTINNPKAAVSDHRHVPTAVWLDRDDPADSSKAYLENPYNRWTDFAFVVGWFVLAAVILAAGFLRRWVRRRHRIYDMGRFGAGLSDEFVRRKLHARHERPERSTITLDD